MTGRLLDYIAQDVAANRPAAEEMAAKIAAGGASIFYANDTQVFSFYNDDTVAWDELNISALTGQFRDLSDIDWTTPPTDGQIFIYHAGSDTMIPVDVPAGYSDEEARDAIGAALAAGTGITIVVDDGADTITVNCTITQYTDTMADAQIALAVLNDLANVDTTTDPVAKNDLLYYDGSNFVPRSQFPEVKTESGTNYDVLNADIGKYIRLSNAAAKTVTFRPDATEALDDNGEWHFRNIGAGDATLTAGAGVTLNAPSGGTLVIPEDGTVTVKRVASDEFDVMGLTT